MAECLTTPVGCLIKIGKSIFTTCFWPPIKMNIDYWWCFDNNIQVLTDGVRDLGRETLDINQRIEEARLRADILRPEVEEWSKAGTEKLEAAKTILQNDINPKAWNLISRYSMGKRAKKAAEEIGKHRNDGNFDAIADSAPPPAMGPSPPRSTMNFVSRERIEEDIIKSLKESSVGMIGICGMGGVGKTTMAERIRERVKKEKLFDEVVMVAVSQQIDKSKIQKDVAESLGLKFDVDVESIHARAYKLRTRLMDKNRKIIIFDDVWERLKLEDLGIPYESGFERCKILLTTRSKDVCKKMGVQKIIAIEILTKEEAWILFKEKAGNCVEDSVLLPVAEDVVAECNGLPIALVTVGEALRNEEKAVWKDSLSQLRRSNPADFPELLTDVYKPLKLSYDKLDNESERLLFLICCLFPEDYVIPVEQLAWYIMGLKIIDDITSIKGARNRTCRLVDKLKSRFLLIDGGRKHHVKMHDIVRDVAIFIGSKEKYGFLKILNKLSIENSTDINCNWMSVGISNEPVNVDMGSCFPKLRLLMLLNLSSDISLEGIGDLNVLSFSDISIGSLPPTLGLLQNLRTLYLYSCAVEDISVIGELAGLEILYCHGCYKIKELPAEIGRLNSLRLLEVNFCSNLRRIAFGTLPSLVRLEELRMLGSFIGWETEENGKEMRNASVRELECLPNLTCLEIEIHDSNLAAQQIPLPPNLVKYRICIAEGWYGGGEDYEKVMKLDLPSEIGAVGKWIQILVKNTEYLRLEGDGSNNINLEECQHLRNLEVVDCSKVEKLVKTKDCKSGIVFSMLERLYLRGVYNLEEICDGTIILNQNVSSLSNLKSVSIKRCSKLRYLFSVSVTTTCLLQLEELEIEECEVMEQVYRNDITDGCIEFPKLKKLCLRILPDLTIILNPNVSSLSNLKSVRIESCPKLRYLFSVSVATTCLLQLEVLEIEECEAMEQVYRNDITYGYVEFPKLKELRLVGLPNLTIILNQNVSSLCNLKSVRIERCPKLRYLFSVSVAATCLLQLEELEIEDCEAMEQVFRNDITDGCIEFPKLKKLKLHYLPNLTLILCQNVSSLCNLKYLCITSCSKLRYLFSVSVATTCLLQLGKPWIGDCEAMEQVFRNDITDGCIEFLKLKELSLFNLPNLTAFSQGLQNIKFPNLTKMWVGELPKLNSFCPLNSETPHDDTNPFHFLCNPKVEIGGLKTLIVGRFNFNNIRNIWCRQIPINIFNNLEELRIHRINGIRSLISHSIAKNLVSLKRLKIRYCEEMVEVLEGNDDDDKEEVDINWVFSTLEELEFTDLPKLRRFWQWNHPLELSLLEKVSINNCLSMETFTLGSLNTPNLKMLKINVRTIYDIKNLNDILHHRFRIKNQSTSKIEKLEEDEDANKDDGKDEHKI